MRKKGDEEEARSNQTPRELPVNPIIHSLQVGEVAPLLIHSLL